MSTPLPARLLEAAELVRTAAEVLSEAEKHPYGIPAAGEVRVDAGKACVKLCDGDADKARTLWKLIAADLGYVPHSSAWSLIRAANTVNLVPDVTPPEPT